MKWNERVGRAWRNHEVFHQCNRCCVFRRVFLASLATTYSDERFEGRQWSGFENVYGELFSCWERWEGQNFLLQVGKAEALLILSGWSASQWDLSVVWSLNRFAKGFGSVVVIEFGTLWTCQLLGEGGRVGETSWWNGTCWWAFRERKLMNTKAGGH